MFFYFFRLKKINYGTSTIYYKYKENTDTTSGIHRLEADGTSVNMTILKDGDLFSVSKVNLGIYYSQK